VEYHRRKEGIANIEKSESKGVHKHSIPLFFVGISERF
jgi:hypothetical protein